MLGYRESPQNRKSVLNPRSNQTTQIQSSPLSRGAAPRSRSAPRRLKPPSPFRAEVAQTSESKDTADIRRQLSITTILHTSGKDNIGQPQSDIRDSPLSPSCHSTNHTHAQSLPRDLLTVQVPIQRLHGIQPGRKKPSRNPRLSDQHQAISRRPQSSMRSFPGERPLRAQSRSCKQAKQQHRMSLALTSFIQHRSINSGDLAALLGRSSGMVRRYGGHAKYTAAGSRFARSAPLHCC
jgi:hypothetical protein